MPKKKKKKKKKGRKKKENHNPRTGRPQLGTLGLIPIDRKREPKQ
jgi:hypothetical protein